jgi:pimeloyl-ACP methyl ester carboxylesterase
VVSVTTFVLIAGAGLGGWTWQKVTRRLEARGHQVYATTLTGSGERAHLLTPEVDLETHVTDVVGTLAFEDLRDVVLVGHSYGGVVATGVADRVSDRVSKLVYVDAPMGRSHLEVFPGAADPDIFPRETVDGIELVALPNEGMVAFYGITDPVEAAWTLERMRPHPWKASTHRLETQDEAALDDVPRYHVVASRTVEMGAHDGLPESERADGQYFELDGPHALMAVVPDELTDVLEQIGEAPTPPSRLPVA